MLLKYTTPAPKLTYHLLMQKIFLCKYFYLILLVKCHLLARLDNKSPFSIAFKTPFQKWGFPLHRYVIREILMLFTVFYWPFLLFLSTFKGTPENHQKIYFPEYLSLLEIHLFSYFWLGGYCWTCLHCRRLLSHHKLPRSHQWILL